VPLTPWAARVLFETGATGLQRLMRNVLSFDSMAARGDLAVETQEIVLELRHLVPACSVVTPKDMTP